MSHYYEPGHPPPSVPFVEYCWFHPEIPAWVRCSRCGRPTCAECTYFADVGQRCPECARPVPVTPSTVRRSVFGLTRSRTAAVPVLVGICVAVFVLDSLAGRAIARFGMSQPYLIYVAGEWWRIATAIFLHAGLLHLLFNMYALYLVGSILEEAWGPPKLVVAFFLTGVFASLVSATTPVIFGSAAQAARAPGSVGASGAIFGLFGALGVALYRRRHSPAARANLGQIVVLVGINLFIGFAVPGIDNLAHLGGLLSGLLVGAGFDVAASRGDNSPAVAAAVVVLAASVALVFLGEAALRQ